MNVASNLRILEKQKKYLPILKTDKKKKNLLTY
jgi:hypothetical protein